MSTTQQQFEHPAIFARITKVDVERRLVMGRATQEVPDRQGEILNYEGSKPYFKEWSESVQKDSGGKSLGNVRAMHGDVAAGKLVELDFNDADRAIDVCAKIVDDAEWGKVLEGVYTGYSIGGSYVGGRGAAVDVEIDGKVYKSYVAKPSEISLVDRPAVPTATFFEVIKADGAIEKKPFKASLPPGESANDTAADAARSVDSGGAGTTAEKRDSAVTTDESISVEVNSPDEISAFAHVLSKYKLTVGGATEALLKVLDPLAPSAEAIAERARALAKAASDTGVEAYKVHLGAAEEALRKEAQDATAAAVTESNSTASSPKKAAATPAELRKGLMACSAFAALLDSLFSLISSAEYEASYEGDNSPIPAKMRAAAQVLGEALEEMIAEEVAEAQGQGASASVLVMAEKVKDFQKRFEKASETHTAVKVSRVQRMHDLAKSMGATCAKADDSAASADKAVVGADAELQKRLTDQDAENAALKKTISDLTATTDALRKDIDALKAQPLPPKRMLITVAKGADAIYDESRATADDEDPAKVSPVRKSDGTVDDVATAAAAIGRVHKKGGATFVKQG